MKQKLKDLECSFHFSRSLHCFTGFGIVTQINLINIDTSDKALHCCVTFRSHRNIKWSKSKVLTQINHKTLYSINYYIYYIDIVLFSTEFKSYKLCVLQLEIDGFDKWSAEEHTITKSYSAGVSWNNLKF